MSESTKWLNNGKTKNDGTSVLREKIHLKTTVTFTAHVRLGKFPDKINVAPYNRLPMATHGASSDNLLTWLKLQA